jgi:hypothetical protein
MGTSLKGKAEHWFTQEVEHPNCIIRDWTFKSVIIGLYRTFITISTSQQAMQQYMNICYSYEEGIMAFYHKLLMWAGWLTEYPDPYSFWRKLFRGLPFEYRQHLALYNGISPEMSTIDDIVQQARNLEVTLISLKTGWGPERMPKVGVLVIARHGPQSSTKPRDKQLLRNLPIRQQQSRSNVSSGM